LEPERAAASEEALHKLDRRIVRRLTLRRRRSRVPWIYLVYHRVSRRIPLPP